MDNSELMFLEILSAGIRGKSAEKFFSNTDWDYIISLAQRHNVERIVYLGLCRSTFISEVGPKRLALLKYLSQQTDKLQEKHIKRMSEVFNNIYSKNIIALPLKGLVISTLYPMANERSMVDADILINKDDLSKVKKILFSMGYSLINDHNEPFHIAFSHPEYPVIEVHWQLFSKESMEADRDIIRYEKLMWKHLIDFNVGETKTKTLSYEDLAVHLSMHMAEYITTTGFGLRHLCDLVLLVEKKGGEIDWDSFIMKTGIYGFERFSIIILALCNELLGMKVPVGIDTKGLGNKKYMDTLIGEIIKCGTYGNTDHRDDSIVSAFFPRLLPHLLNKKISRPQMLEWMEIN